MAKNFCQTNCHEKIFNEKWVMNQIKIMMGKIGQKYCDKRNCAKKKSKNN